LKVNARERIQAQSALGSASMLLKTGERQCQAGWNGRMSKATRHSPMGTGFQYR
jgi:hypothetical protein